MLARILLVSVLCYCFVQATLPLPAIATAETYIVEHITARGVTSKLVYSKPENRYHDEMYQKGGDLYDFKEVYQKHFVKFFSA